MEPHEVEELILRWRGTLFSAAFGVLGSYADAEDAVAETLVRIVRHGKTLRDTERFGAWARRIAVNEARRIGGRRKTDALAEEPRENPPSALALDVRAALDALPASLAATLSGYYLDGQSVLELAARLQVPEGTIKWRLARGRGLLKTTLKGYEPMNEPPTAALAAFAPATSPCAAASS